MNELAYDVEILLSHLTPEQRATYGAVKIQQRLDAFRATPIPEERTAEMEQTICQLRELAKNADYLAGASPAAINRLLDHIEGKGK